MNAEYDVMKDFGAVGDGKTDDSDAIQKGISQAVDRLESVGCSPHRLFGATLIRFPTPPSYYRLTKGLVIRNGHPMRLVGTSPGAVVLKLESPGNQRDLGFTPPLPLSVSPTTPPKATLSQQWTEYLAWVRSRYLVYFAKLLLEKNLDPLIMTDSPNAELMNSVEGLTLVGGGVLVGGLMNTRFTALRDCTIRCAPESALKAEDQTITNADISRCVIEDCRDGVTIGFAQCDFWTLNQCHFERNSGIDLLLGTSGCHVYDCDFRGKRAAPNGDLLPYVQIKEGPSPDDKIPVHYAKTGNFGKAVQGDAGNNRFIDCRFGDDVTPPSDLIVIGPLGPKGTYAKALAGAGPKFLSVADVQFDGCVFGGSKYSKSTRPTSMLRLTASCRGLRIVGCAVWGCAFFVREDAVEFTKDEANGVSSMSFSNTLEYLTAMGHIGRLFSRGGRGFEIAGEVARDLGYPEPDPGRPSTNLLRGADATWGALTELELSTPPGKALIGLVAADLVPGSWPTGIEAPGPFVWDFTPTLEAVELSEVLVAQRLDLDTAGLLLEQAGGGPAVFSVWLRKGQLSRFILEVAWSGFVIGGGTGGEFVSTMTDHWERFEAVVERLPTSKEMKAKGGYSIGPAVRIRVRNHLLKQIKTTEPAFSLAMLQFEVGRTASPFSPSRSVTLPRGPRTFQYAALGGHVIEAAASEPKEDKDGWHNAGDLILDTHPTQWRGWICTQAGAPGTWQRFGSVI